ncbi:MAG: hypothetical protein ACK5AB_09880 [Bacteroidota bacterium]|jgi:hypothetical protein
MKKLLLFSIAAAISFGAFAQKDTTQVIDNKGTIKWVISNTAAVITKQDSTLLYVTPKQIGDSIFVKNVANGLTKSGQTVELGGALNKTTTIQTTATEFLQITGLQRGSNTTDSVVVVDPLTGQLKFISASSLFNALSFSNGLTKTENLVELGGDLTKSTTIGTSEANTLKISGLRSGNLATDSLVVSESDGTLRRVTAESLLQSGDQNFNAVAGQSAYAVTNMPAAVSKVWVYRNGVKLLPTVDYTIASGQVNFTSSISSLVAAGDVIEIQWVK